MFLANLYNQVSEKVSEQVKNAINEPVEPKKMAEVKEGGHKATLVPDSAKVFQLPITYLDKSRIHNLSDIVAKDLELTESPLEKCMYDYVFEPNTKFAKETAHKWQTYFTSDVDFLHDTQNVVKEMDKMELSKMDKTELDKKDQTNNGETVNCEKIQTIWNNLKHDSNFLDKYGYMEWDCLKSFNKSAGFLQTMTVANILSPLMSFLIPIIFFIMPFLVLKIQGVPITFEIYINVLKSIARHHFIGKALINLQTISLDKILYVLGMFVLYLFQMYQNTMQCLRFYKNTQDVNDSLCELKHYVDIMIHKMTKFVSLHSDKSTYHTFNEVTKKHISTLEALRENLKHIYPFQCSIYKVGDIGYMLKNYYELYENKDYENSLLYSMGFEGYLQQLNGLYENYTLGFLGMANFSSEEEEEEELGENEEKEEEEKETDSEKGEEKEEKKKGNPNKIKIINQYYPPHASLPECVKNDVTNMNMVITGPNASGKTTFLKTTALNILFSQQFGMGFYKSATLKPYTHLHSYLNIPDTSGRDSLFQAESRRCKEIIDCIQKYPEENGFHHFCIFDELYSGTNPEEATKSAYAFMKYLSETHNHVDFLLTTHYVSICDKWENKKEEKSKKIMNYKMETEEDDDNGDIRYTYKITRGISRIQGAIKVLKEMDYPTEILDLFS